MLENLIIKSWEIIGRLLHAINLGRRNLSIQLELLKLEMKFSHDMIKNYKVEYQKLLHKYQALQVDHEDLQKEIRLLVNYILKIKKRCESESLWLIASHDPYKPLIEEEQQGPLITKLYQMVVELKRKFK